MNITNNLPEDIDTFLMDIAQMANGSDGQTINYTNILNFANIATTQDIQKIKKLMKIIINDYEFDLDDDEVKVIITEIIDFILNKN